MYIKNFSLSEDFILHIHVGSIEDIKNLSVTNNINLDGRDYIITNDSLFMTSNAAWNYQRLFSEISEKFDEKYSNQIKDILKQHLELIE